MQCLVPEYADPMLALMAAECESVEDEFDVQALAERDELIAAAEIFKNHLSSFKE